MVEASAYVNVWVGGERKEANRDTQGRHGVARLLLTLNPNEENIPISMGHCTIVGKHPVVEYDGCHVRRFMA